MITRKQTTALATIVCIVAAMALANGSSSVAQAAFSSSSSSSFTSFGTAAVAKKKKHTSSVLHATNNKSPASKAGFVHNYEDPLHHSYYRDSNFQRRRAISITAEDYYAAEQQQATFSFLSSLKQKQTENENDSVSSSTTAGAGGVSVLSAALLITGNTVGAGALVLPELAMGPGLSWTMAVFVMAYLVNLISGLILADVAITQKESQQLEENDGGDVPSSFKEFAQANLGHEGLANMVSGISLFVNYCVLAFDISRMGSVGSALLGMDPLAVSAMWGVLIMGLLSTVSSKNISNIASVCVMGLFASFGGLLIPGLLDVPDLGATLTAPGTSPDCISCLAQTAPIILMSMVYQNIVPTVTKQLDYDRTKTATALVTGSAIPLFMYVAWITASLGGGIDLSNLTQGVSGILMTVFSLATLCGASMGSGMSLAEELDSSFFSNSDNNDSDKSNEDQAAAAPAFPLPAAAAAVSVPLVAALTLGGGGEGLTGALSIAGSFGSPLLYGVLPALMAWNQRKQQREAQPNSTNNLVPLASLPLLGVLSTGFVGQEMLSRVEDMLALAI